MTRAKKLTLTIITTNNYCSSGKYATIDRAQLMWYKNYYMHNNH